MPSPELGHLGGESQQKKESLLIQTVDNVIKEVLLQTTPLTVDRIRKKQGMTVRNVRREGEDPEGDIDLETEKSIGKALDQLGQKYDISFQVYSEHSNFTTGSRPPYYPVSIDPIENTDELVKGLSDFYVTPWTVLAVYDYLDNAPIGAGAVNLAHPNDSFVVRDGRNYHHTIADLQSEGDVEFSPQPLVEDVRDPKLVIATYRAKEKYDLEFIKYFSKLKQERDPLSTIISTGGNYIYVPVALGLVHYVAPIEPYEEVFAGLPFLLAQGGEVRIVPSEGKSISIKTFRPELLEERANLLLASLSKNLLDQLEKCYRDRRKELKPHVEGNK